MRSRTRNPFSTVKTAGLLLPIDLLARIADGDPSLPGLTPESYHLEAGDRLNEAAARAWNECSAAWKRFRQEQEKLPASDAGTTLTRERWLLPLFKELGYGRLQPQKAIPIEDKTYPISHAWGGHIPIHLVSCKLELDKRTPGAAGAATRSPYSLVQELLNRSAQHRWGFLSNGRMLYILRDNVSLTRAANVEFDLEAMFGGDIFADFKLLFLLCHESRVEIPSDGKPEDCWLEKWSKLADDQGTRAREKLRDGVESAIKALGAGFLITRGNSALRDRLRSGELATQDYYRQLLRMVYRLLLLLVAEEKKDENGQNLLHPPGTPDQARKRYAQFYSIGRLRTLAGKRRGTTHTDLYESLMLLFLKLRNGYEPLGIPGLGSFLFSPKATPDLDSALLSNEALLDAIRAICITDDSSGRGGVVRRPVDFANLGSDELGSVYESLLELHPKIDSDEGPFTLGVAAGHERKTTGSYYTPTSLINCLLDSALDPVAKEALNKPTTAGAEKALLNLKICDPACGSGHFLIAATERLAKYLASLRTGDEEPSTLAVQHAKRDIISRCVYGVDMNPMAVELCQVALWMEALDPGRPFSFLEHHIQCGNSLLGTTPALLRNGLPDEAFTAIEGDVKARVSALKKQNKQERKDFARGQGYLDYTQIDTGDLSAVLAQVDEASGETTAGIAEKERRYAEFVKGSSYQHQRLLADTWCAAFVWKKDDTDLGKHCPTEKDFRKVESHAAAGLLSHVRPEVERLRDQYQFFHWHLAFPDVFRLPGKDESPENEQTGWSGGFNVVLGNPPWEKLNISEKEWFADRLPELANARNAAARRTIMKRLEIQEPALIRSFHLARRISDGTDHLIRSSDRYPLCGRGDINVYTIFAELNRTLIRNTGRIGCIVPTGIATEKTTQHFFRDLLANGGLFSLYDFENREQLFPNVAPPQKFCLITFVGSSVRHLRPDFVFFATNPSHLQDLDRHFSLDADQIKQLNPNTHTCPVFRNRTDAELAKLVYSRFPVLIDESTGHNTWNIELLRMFHMSDDSELFETYEELLDAHWVLDGNRFSKDDSVYVPLYEPKLFHQFNHRYNTFEGTAREDRFKVKAFARPLSEFELSNPDFVTMPRYWIPAVNLFEKLGTRRPTTLIAFRKIINVATNRRTAVFSFLPCVAANDAAPLFYCDMGPTEQLCLLANLNSFVFDYCARQKLGGSNFNHFILQQLPVLSPHYYKTPQPSLLQSTPEKWVADRAMELVYTAWDLEGFASEIARSQPPFAWNNERRFHILCEIDAYFFVSYFGMQSERDSDGANMSQSSPSAREAVSYIMDTFPIVRRKDEEKHDGDYRTKRVILEIYDAMQEAIRNGQPYQSRLDPPPGPPSEGLPEWKPGQPKPANWPSHIHPPRGCRATPTDEWRISEMNDGAILPRSFKLMLEESEATGGIERRWKGKLLGDGDGLPDAESWVLVRHPDLKRGSAAVPVALGKLSYQELMDASTKRKVMVVTLRGTVPPAQVRIPLEDWPSFRPLAVLEPLDS